ncbi:MAG: hypothetical protein E7522_01855 [Ruminococcaceae bacterium]|nr:hypothetical protein [Oscillospiraceae bacterium]
MYNNTEKFLDYLNGIGMNFFSYERKNEDDVLFHNESSNGVNLRTVIAFVGEQNIDVLYDIATCTDVMKKEQIIQLLNKFNIESRLKFWLYDDGSIRAGFTYWGVVNEFDPADFFKIYAIFLNELLKGEEVKKIMRIIWG